MFKQIIDGRTDLVFDWIAEGNEPTATDSGGTSLLRWVAYHGDVSALRYLLDAGESLPSLGTDLGLNGAAFHGHWQLVQFLIDQGANANSALQSTGETPLHAALCKANRPRYDHVVQVLLAAGANPNAKTIPGAETGCFMRDSRTTGETPLHRAAAYGTESAIQMLLDAGGDKEARDKNQDSPLSWASKHLRPASILRQLCFGEHRIHPENPATYDHGAGWGHIDTHLRTRPHLDSGGAI